MLMIRSVCDMTAVSHLFSDSRVSTFFFNRRFSLVHCITLWTVANSRYTAVVDIQCGLIIMENPSNVE